MSHNDEFEQLRQLAEALDDQTTFRGGDDIRQQVHEISAVDERDERRGRRPYVLAVAAVALALLVGGTVFSNSLNAPAVTSIDPAGPSGQLSPAGQQPDDGVPTNDAETAQDREESELEAVESPEEQRRPIGSRPPIPTTSGPASDATVPTLASTEGGAEDVAGGPEINDPTAATGNEALSEQASEPLATTTTAPVSTTLGPSPSTQTTVPVEPTTPVTEPPTVQRASQVYDAFSDDVYLGAGGPTNYKIGGFEVGSDWLVSGSGSISYLNASLDYVDSAGYQLVTYPGSLLASPTDRMSISRPLDGTYDPVDVYYVSFLIYVASNSYGDAFWTPPDRFTRGALGVQQSGNLRFVNGPSSQIPVSPGTTHFVVGRISTGVAEMWINPELNSPGPAHVVQAVESVPATSANFSFSRLVEGTYLIDEFRMGYTWRSVAPN